MKIQLAINNGQWTFDKKISNVKSQMSNALGITLVEILVVMAITSVIGVLLVRILINNTGLFVKQTAKVQQGLGLNDSLTKIRASIREASTIGSQYPENPTVTPTPGANLLTNPEFTTDVPPWVGNNANITRDTAEKYNGVAGGKVINRAEYTIDNFPGVNKPSNGTYTATAYVIGDSSQANTTFTSGKCQTERGVPGKPLGVVIRTFNAQFGVIQEIGGDWVCLRSDIWQQVGVSVDVNDPSITKVNVYVYQNEANPGEYFYTDDVTLSVGGGPNLIVSNPGFEDPTTDPWVGYLGTLERVGDPRYTGNASAKVTYTKAAYSIDSWYDTQNTQNPVKDTQYNASVWVKCSTAGRNIGLVIREHGNNENRQIDLLASPATCSGAWQQITASYTVVNFGMTGLNVYAYQNPAYLGDYFYADSFVLTRGSGGGDATPTPPDIFTTSPTTLILKIPSTNILGYTISDVFDYAIYFKDGNKLRYKLIPDSKSYRRAEDIILVNNADNVVFKYYSSTTDDIETTNYPSVVRVKATVTLKEKAGISFEINTATSEANLRNTPNN